MSIKRDLNEHRECLRLFGIELKKEITSNLAFWEKRNPEAAKQRAAAFSLVLSAMRDAAESANVPLQDIGIEDFTLRVNRRQALRNVRNEEHFVRVGSIPSSGDLLRATREK